MRYGLAAFMAEWKRAPLGTRYFLAAHLVANAMIIVGAAASLVAGLLGDTGLQMGLLAAAALGAVQAGSTWSMLQRRLGARYSLW